MTGGNRTTIERIAAFTSTLSCDKENGVAAAVGAALVDTVGCMLVGAASDVAVRTRQAVSAFGKGDARLFGTARSAPPPWAALANAVAAHAYDFDDWEEPGNTHCSAVLFPAILAAASGRGLSGAELADAYAAGFEVIARLGEMVNFDHYDRGFHSTATLGSIGAAGAVARLMGLDATRTAYALSLAVSRAGGLTCQFGAGSKPLQAGAAAETGVVAASLAASGITAQPGSLDGPGGFMALYGPQRPGGVDRERVEGALGRLGQPLAILEHGIVVKPYPCCSYIHRLIDCALAVRAMPGFAVAEIERVDCSLLAPHAAIAHFGVPTRMSEAQFSVPYSVAVALRSGGVEIADFTGETWREPEVDALMARTTVLPRTPKRPELNYDPEDPDTITVRLRGGRALRAEAVFQLGAPRNPLPRDGLIRKFRANAGLAVTGEDAREAALGNLLALEPDCDVFGTLAAFQPEA
ncbi:MAG: hypothetical protein GC150_01925 [Rhizobiales bacterium]|nr:hypothetical protein [Hyphomicrobiales bacterium]